MNYGAEPADQVVRYSLEGMEYSLKACGSLYCCRLEGPEKDKRENKTYQNVKGTAPDEIFYRSG